MLSYNSQIVMIDKQIVEKLIANDSLTIKNFFFVRCKPMLVYIGQYFCQERHSPEELIGEFYEFLSADEWHKLKIFKYSCSLNSYVTIIASRYFQHKRDKEMLSLDENIDVVENMQDDRKCNPFFMEDLSGIIRKLPPFDRFLVQRILIDGEKPGDIIEEAKTMLMDETCLKTGARTDNQFAGYVYTRYNRIRKRLQNQMTAMGYGK